LTTLQKYLSYILRIVVERTKSQYNPQLIVAIQNGKYVLNANYANYSFASLHRVFQQAINKVEINEKTSILLLGCGAGSIPTIIYKELNLNPKIDAIEIDEKVIQLGNKYFDLGQFSNLNIVIDDAMKFVSTTSNKYDLILVDLFNGINVPEEFLSQEFFKKLKSSLENKGQILLNFVAYNHETKKKVNEIKELLNNSFPDNIKVYRLENINRVFHVQK